MFPEDEHWDSQVFMNRITDICYAKVFYIAEESTGKDVLKLFYALGFSTAAQEGK